MSSPIDTNQTADFQEIQDNDASEELFLIPETTYTQNDFWGHEMNPKQPNMLRIYYQNVNGITCHGNWDKWQHGAQMCFNKQIDICCFVETNVTWNPTTKNRATKILRETYQTGTIVTSHCDGNTLTQKQQGGTCIGITGSALGSISDKGEDARGLGRWSYCILNGRENTKLVIITVYRVRNVHGSGDNTVYQQQYRALRQQHVQFPNPQQQSDQDLIVQLQAWRKEKYEIILTIDSNTSMTNNHLRKIVNSGDMQDVLGYLHGIDRPNTYISGTDPIDFIFGTALVVQAVQRGGMLAFHEGILSDHRALWIDVSIPILFHNQMPPVAPHRLYYPLKNPKWEAKVKKTITKGLQESQVISRLQILHTNEPTMTRTQIINELEHIDNLIHQAMLTGAKIPRNRNIYWWSPTLRDASLAVHYWRLRRTQHITKLSMDRGIQEILNQLSPEHPLHQQGLSKSINHSLRKALTHLKQCHRDHYLHRVEFLNQRRVDHNMVDSKSAAKAVHIINKSEITSATYQKIGRYLKPSTHTTLSFIDIPGAGGDRRVTSREELEEHLLKHHKTHFSQAQHTPLASEKVLARFGPAADTPYADKFRQGDSSELQHWEHSPVKDFLSRLIPTATDPPQVDSHITLQNVKEGLRVWPTRTTTSPLGRRLILYKMWLTASTDSDILDGDAFLQMITDVINLSHKYEHPLKRWSTVHNIYIPKKPGVYYMHRLRPLHIIDAELNLVRRELISRRLLWNAELYNMIPSNNRGGRAGKMAHDAVMLKYLSISTCHMQRRNCALTDCDAKSCYDRVLPHILSLCYSKLGLPASTCRWLSRALVNMKYHVQTSHGVSQGISQSDKDGMVFGVGQGATDAPTGRLFISAFLSHLYDSEANGSFLYDPQDLVKLAWSHVLFVDDAYLFHTAPQLDVTERQLQAIVQHDVSRWNNGLDTSGGKLEATKSSYYTLLWSFHPDGQPYLDDTSHQTHNPVYIDTAGNREFLQYISPIQHSSEYKSLGVRMPGDLSNDYELQAIRVKCDRFAVFLTA